MGPAIANDRTSGNINIRKIQNGYEVTYNKETKKLSADGNQFLYDYVNEAYAFSTLEEAVGKAKELGTGL